MKHAWIENGRIRDISPGNPVEFYHLDVAKFYDTLVPDDAAKDDYWDGTTATKPPVPTTPEPTPRQWTADNFRTGMTLAEKTKWDNNGAPEIITVKAELPKELAGAIELLDFLVTSSVITEATKTKILA
jgi:hypothetical protein